MNTQQEHLEQAHRAVRDLAAAVGRFDRAVADASQWRLLAEDVARISGDIDRLTGRAPSPPGVANGPHDTDYDPRQFVDGTADIPSHHRHV
jgi:hypothetical protein